MALINVNVKFDGLAQVEVPDHLCQHDAEILAERLALAQILATFDNPDCGECLEAACQEFIGESEGTSEDFDNAKTISVFGDWTTSPAAFLPRIF